MMIEGYHTDPIDKGVLGEKSKIIEEYLEWLNANDQNCIIMELLELSDLIGAIKHYTMSKYNISIEDLIKMNDITERAFKNGVRK